jgi:Zn-dependent peptidase ImmA (M78 family)
MKLFARYNYLNNLLEKAKEEYAGNPQFSTELEIVSLNEECRQLLSKINEENQYQYLYLREFVNFYEIYPSINETSLGLIKKLGDKIELPINVQKIAILCGFEGIELDDGLRSGKHAMVSNNTIYVNRNEPEEERNFSIAHEIGHKILGPRKDIMKDVARKGNHWKSDILLKESAVSNEEIETLLREEIIDYFAANLLMPTHIFKNWSSQPDKIIAEKFRVSEKSLRKRRVEIAREIQE